MTTPYQQQPYGAPAPRPHPRGVAILVLGIISIVICFPCGIVGLLLSQKAMKEIDAAPAEYTNRSMVNIGRILSIIGIALWVVGLIVRYAT